MINLVKRFLNGERTAAGDENQDSAHDIRIATCALLLEMANTDGKFSESEKTSIISYLKNDFNLSGEEVDKLIKTTVHESDNSIDLWQFTSLINKNYTIDEKIGIIEAIWTISYADGILDKYEDYLVHKLANLLHLSQKQLIDAKLKVLYEAKH